MSSAVLRFEGSTHFRQRLVCSTLSGRPIRIDKIRAADQSPGLRDFEACLLRLLEKVTDGCVVEISETGTSLRYKPGIITGASGLVHECGTARGIGYFLEPLVCISLFGKRPLSISLRGITNSAEDPSVDIWRAVTLPLLRKVTGAEGQFSIKIVKRGAPPLGGGEVRLAVPTVRALPPVSLLEEGMVKRIRGVAHSMRVSPQSSNRMVDGARGMLNQLLADVYVFTDHMSGPEAGLSPGYGVMLVAETTTGRFIAEEACATAETMGNEAAVPEDVGRQAAKQLFEEISRGGAVDSTHQGLILLLCAVGPAEVNEVRLGLLTPYSVQTLRHVKDCFGVTFAIRPEKESQTIFLSCIGAGIQNTSKAVTDAMSGGTLISLGGPSQQAVRLERDPFASLQQSTRRRVRLQPVVAKMLNDENELVDLYLPRKCSWTNKLITSKDHGAVQINIGHLNEEGVYVTGQFSTFALVGTVRAVGEGDSAIDLLWQKQRQEVGQ